MATLVDLSIAGSLDIGIRVFEGSGGLSSDLCSLFVHFTAG
jgi:hypothetical protein